MDVVIVESPAKAKTIREYLGGDCAVLASYGHVRDLLPKDGSVLPEKDFAMVWQAHTGERARKNFKEIAQAVKGASRLILATDPDREGEAIAWHVLEMLRQKKLLAGMDVARISFNAITRASVQEAMRNPRDLDQELIDAYLARRALDYLVGFNLSPVLWRKLPGARSAGRVQSVALRLVCERELEIEGFRAREYWSVDASMRAADGESLFSAAAVSWKGEKLEKFSLPDAETAERLRAEIEQAERFRVLSVESKEARRHPPPPFITSSLQQEASRKLGFAADRTMGIAQRLYEGVSIGGGAPQGLITYMRTDGVQMAPEAVTAVRKSIRSHFSAEYLPPKPRLYKSKAKNAQEAHEAIRPVDPARHPKEMRAYLSEDEAKLYELIWKRALASQMESARLRQSRVEIDVEEGAAGLRATGSVLLFDGFLRLYREGREEEDKSKDGDKNGDGDRLLPPLSEGDSLALQAVEAKQHFTEPPPRFTESSLVKKLEELGIGRPSTYASTLALLRDRGYVHLRGRTLFPDDKGRLVTAFLAHFFARYLDYGFTAELEESLDGVSAGKLNWKRFLGEFWKEFIAAVEDTQNLRIGDVIDHLNETLAPYVFPKAISEDGSESEDDPRICPQCGDGLLSIKLGRFGAFVGCSRHPDCAFKRPFNPAEGGALPEGEGTQSLGTDPQSGLEVTRRSGRFGPYLQLGEQSKEAKPKRVSIPPSMDNADLDLEKSLALLALPREVGAHPESGAMIAAGLNRYGPFLRHEGKFVSLESVEDALEIGLNRAVEILNAPPARKRKNIAPLRELGAHPEDDAPVALMDGRYGPYVKHGKINATVPQGSDLETLTLEEAVRLLEEKKNKPARTFKARGKSRAGAKKKASPKRRA